jgi:hypothetical protein
LTLEQRDGSKTTGRAEACRKLPYSEFKLDDKTRGNLVVLKPLKHLKRSYLRYNSLPTIGLEYEKLVSLFLSIARVVPS